MRGINHRVAELLSEAMCAEDAEGQGVDARDLVADPDRAAAVLGDPGVSPTARDAVVQRFGGVGALLLVACEDEWQRRQAASSVSEHGAAGQAGAGQAGAGQAGAGQAGAGQAGAGRQDPEHTETVNTDTVHVWLGELLHRFTELSPTEMDWLVEQVESYETEVPPSQAAIARRWLHVTYAIAARDGTDESHHAYVQALDGVLDQTRALVAI